MKRKLTIPVPPPGWQLKKVLPILKWVPCARCAQEFRFESGYALRSTGRLGIWHQWKHLCRTCGDGQLEYRKGWLGNAKFVSVGAGALKYINEIISEDEIPMPLVSVPPQPPRSVCDTTDQAELLPPVEITMPPPKMNPPKKNKNTKSEIKLAEIPSEPSSEIIVEAPKPPELEYNADGNLAAIHTSIFTAIPTRRNL